MTQQLLRQKILNQRRSLTSLQCIEHGQLLLDHIKQTNILKPKYRIGVYFAVFGEISLQPLIEYCWKHNIQCYSPILQSKPDSTLLFGIIRPKDKLQKNQFGILESIINDNEVLMPNALDVVFCPLVAFDLNGHRIGMGKGYYDRTFSFRKHATPPPLLIGCGHSFQQVHVIESQPWDVKLDGIVTEQKIIYPKVV